MKSYIPAILVLSLLSACNATTNSKVAPSASHDYSHVFTSVGYASVKSQPGSSFDMKILNAIKASKLDAYKEMAEQIHGVLITAAGNSERTVLTEDVVNGKVSGLVRGAHVLKSYHEGDIYITELELNMNTLPYLNTTEFDDSGRGAIKVGSKVERAVYY